MLRFAKKPDPVFLELLYSALEIRRDMVRELAKESDVEEWRDSYPELAPYFTPQALVSLIDRLLTASNDSRVFDLTDYHWLVIYDCMESFCDLVNDDAKMSPDRMRRTGPYQIGSIDFGLLADVFFWDADFLHGRELMRLAGKERERRHISSESFNIAAGHPPHPDELKITLWEEAPGWEEAYKDVPASGVIPRYPPTSEEEDGEEKGSEQ